MTYQRIQQQPSTQHKLNSSAEPEHPIFPHKPDINLTPEEKLDIQQTIEDAIAKREAEKEQKAQRTRSLLAQYTKTQSVKTQVEIYLSVATDSDVDFNSDSNLIEILSDIKKQNDMMAGYATYKELEAKHSDSFST